MVYSESNDMQRARTSLMGQVIVDKISKVKGKKVRKHLIQMATEVVENIRDVKYREIEKSKLNILSFNYAGVLTSLCDSKDLIEYINSEGVLDRVLFSLDQMKTSLLYSKVLVL